MSAPTHRGPNARLAAYVVLALAVAWGFLAQEHDREVAVRRSCTERETLRTVVRVLVAEQSTPIEAPAGADESIRSVLDEAARRQEEFQRFAKPLLATRQCPTVDWWP